MTIAQIEYFANYEFFLMMYLVMFGFFPLWLLRLTIFK